MDRGIFIVFEGCDKVGKSTQCQQLVTAMSRDGHKVKLLKFPDRTTAIGKAIDEYLNNKVELEDHAIHLLFSANRWESVPEIKRLLSTGTSLVVDRYAFSGVAFTAAKMLSNTTLQWCKSPDVGLPAPDVVFYLTLPADAAQAREDYGSERYERANFQAKVAQRFESLRTNSWHVLDASRSIGDIHTDIWKIVQKVIKEKSATPLGQLWTDQKATTNRESV